MKASRSEQHRRFAPPTPEQCALIEKAAQDAANDPDGSPWFEIAKLIGPTALLVVLDILGGEKPHVPTRKEFFEGLFRRLRDATIVELSRTMPVAELAKRFALTPRMIRHILAKAPKRTTLPPRV